MRKAARIKRDAEIDRMLEEGWSVAIVAKTVGLTERTIYSRKAALHRVTIESDPLLAELAELEKQFPISELPPIDGGVLGVLEKWKLLPTELMRRCPTCGKEKKAVDNPRLYVNVCECDVKYDG